MSIVTCILAATISVSASPTGSHLAVIQEAPPFELTTQDGKALRLSDLKGKVVIVGFIFTTCNGTCPATTHRMAKIQDALKDTGLLRRNQAQLISISLDPERDTPAALRRYASLYDVDLKSWSFLTGAPSVVKKVHKAWGMWARPAANGQLDHPSRVFLLDGKGRIREIYNLAFLKTKWVLADVQHLLLDD